MTIEAYRESEGVAILRQLYEQPTVAIAVDTETTGLKVPTGKDRCIGVVIAGLLEDGTPFSHYYPTGHPVDGETVSEQTLAMLKYVLEQEGRPLIYANVQFDVLSLETIGIFVGDQEFYDILTMANMVNENTPVTKSVATLSMHYLGEQGKLDTPEIKKEKESGWPTTTAEQMWDYAIGDAVTTWRVWDQLIQHPEWTIMPADVWIWKQDTIRVLTEMKRRGVRINQDICRREIAIGEAVMAETLEKLGYKNLGRLALEDLFIRRLGLPVIKYTPTKQICFDKTVMGEYDLMLARLEEASEEASLVLEYRGWQKAVSASYKAYLTLVDEDGRLRCSYRTDTTVSGRLSCREPNLQQIPKVTDKPWNRHVKESFEADEGYALVEFDYAQLELRISAAYAGEESLKAVFNEGRDIFAEFAESLNLDRGDAKTFVYTINYGGGKDIIAVRLGVDVAKATEIRQNYHDTYPRLKALSDSAMSRAKQTKRVRIWSGRYRHFRYANESYKALNSVIQGGAADVVERIMVRAFKEIDNEDCRLLMQVHDSLIWEIKISELESYIERIKTLMQDVEPKDFDVHFDVEAKILGAAAEEKEAA